MRLLLFGVAFLCCAVLSVTAQAEVIRFAVVVGTNQGEADDVELSYAESDASKVAGVLRQMGNFHPANIALLRNEDGPTFRNTLVSVNERIRRINSKPNTQTVLFVYYSGHADAESLRLKNSRLPIRELGALVSGSAATFRVLVLDSCRSGALTRVKGGTVVAPFKIQHEPRLKGEGLAFLTASSANEDAQESDEIKGSFFTHGFVSGLLGAADRDRDGNVVLEEAYRYAYDATVRASSRSYAGVQHPTFQFDLRGDDGLVLTRVGQRNRATVIFPPNLGFLVFKSGSQGAVVGEIARGDRVRRLSLAPGAYFVRGRGADYLLEGTLSVTAGATSEVSLDNFERVEFARLVRKGGATKTAAHGPEVGIGVRSSLPTADTPCPKLNLGYRVVLPSLTLLVRGSACRASFENRSLTSEVEEYAASGAVRLTWDLPWVSLASGVGVGTMFSNQRFEGRGLAPARLSTHPFAFADIALTKEIWRGTFASAELSPQVYLLQIQDTPAGSRQRQAHFTLSGNLLVGLLF